MTPEEAREVVAHAVKYPDYYAGGGPAGDTLAQALAVVLKHLDDKNLEVKVNV